MTSQSDLPLLRERIEKAAILRDLAAIQVLVQEFGTSAVRLDKKAAELTALHYAAAGGSSEVVAYLLAEVAADPRAARNNAFTPLHASAMVGHTEVCRLLLDAGADINAQTKPQLYAPLHSAAFAGHMETIRLLLKRGADRTLLNYRGETPYATAMRTGKLKAAKLLVAEDA